MVQIKNKREIVTRKNQLRYRKKNDYLRRILLCSIEMSLNPVLLAISSDMQIGPRGLSVLI